MYYSRMDKFALNLVIRYISGEVNTKNGAVKSDFDAFIVHKSMVLGNWAYIIGTNLYSDRYFRVTYKGDISEWYMDVYQEFDSMFLNQSGELERFNTNIGCNGDSCPIEGGGTG